MRKRYEEMPKNRRKTTVGDVKDKGFIFLYTFMLRKQLIERGTTWQTHFGLRLSVLAIYES